MFVPTVPPPMSQKYGLTSASPKPVMAVGWFGVAFGGISSILVMPMLASTGS
jgi:hypothetical protein